MHSKHLANLGSVNLIPASLSRTLEIGNNRRCDSRFTKPFPKPFPKPHRLPRRRRRRHLLPSPSSSQAAASLSVARQRFCFSPLHRFCKEKGASRGLSIRSQGYRARNFSREWTPHSFIIRFSSTVITYYV